MKPDVLIVGGGIAGLALALFLKGAGITSTVFEASAQANAVQARELYESCCFCR